MPWASPVYMAIKHNHNNAGGGFRNQRRNAGNYHVEKQHSFRPAFDKVKTVFSADEVRREDEHADKRRQSRSKGRAEDAHAAGKDKYPIQEDI